MIVRGVMRVILGMLAVAICLLGLVIYVVKQPVWTTPNSIDVGVQVDAAALRRDVEYLVKAFVPRDAFYPDNLQRMARYLTERFTEAGARVSRQEYEIDGRTYVNVIASYGPEESGRIIVGAHYDTCCELPGADDNTSGVVGLLALAPLLAKVELRQRVDLIAFTLEEPPFYRTEGMGSAHHAASLARDKADVRLMIALEMIGYFNDTPNSQEYPLPIMRWLYPRTGNYLAVVGKLGDGRIVRTVKARLMAGSALPVYSINAPRSVPGVDFSDHLNYWQHGYPAVMLTDTAFYRNQNYHTASDTPDTLDYRRMAEVVRGVYYLLINYP